MGKVAKKENKGKCPYCGSDKGYSIWETVRHDLYFTMDDKPDGRSQNTLMAYAKCKKCRSCGKTIGKVK